MDWQSRTVRLHLGTTFRRFLRRAAGLRSGSSAAVHRRRNELSVADLVYLRGQADAAIETFEHLERFVFDSGRDVSAVRKRFHKHVEVNWNSDFPRVVARLRRTAVDGGASTLVALMQAAEDLIACHDLLGRLEDYARPGDLTAVCFGGLAEGESAARRLSKLVGMLVESLAAVGLAPFDFAMPVTSEVPPKRSPGLFVQGSGPDSFEAFLPDPNHGRTQWSDTRRVPPRIWREAARRARQDWPQILEPAFELDGNGTHELIPREILDRREREAATPVVQVSIRGATFAVTRLQVSLLEQLAANAVRQRVESSPIRLDAGAMAERLLMRPEPLAAALESLLQAGLAEPFQARRMSAMGGACRITPRGVAALAAAGRATAADALPGGLVVEIGGDEPDGEASEVDRSILERRRGRRPLA